MLLDGVTPVAAYHALRSMLPGPSFLFESAPGAGELARHSVIGLGAVGHLTASRTQVRLVTPRGRVTTTPASVLACIRRLLAECSEGLADLAPSPFAGAYGLATFEFAGLLEHLPFAPAPRGEPELHLIVPAVVIVFDHYTHLARIMTLDANGRTMTSAVAMRISEATAAPLVPTDAAHQVRRIAGPTPFGTMVNCAQQAICDGEVFQIVLAQRWEADVEGDSLDVYRRLRSINPSPYMFYLQLGERVVLGSSPEMLCQLAGRRARVRPLAGTRPRPASRNEELRVADELRNDPKEQAEHIMLVDLARNDLGRISDYTSVTVVELLSIENYSHVMHLVSEVQGSVRADCDAIDLFAATFPAGTVSGAPKIRAMELIAQLEGSARGAYGGSVVRFGFDGSMDACIVLRSAELHGGVVCFNAGAGIVADSVAEREDAECRAKAAAMVRALGAGLELFP